MRDTVEFKLNDKRVKVTPVTLTPQMIAFIGKYGKEDDSGEWDEFDEALMAGVEQGVLPKSLLPSNRKNGVKKNGKASKAK